jgi:hypothetical protein
MASSAVWCSSGGSSTEDGAAGEELNAGGKKKRQKGVAHEKKDIMLAVGFHSGVVHLYSGAATGANWKFIGPLPAASTVGPISAMAYSPSSGLVFALLPSPASPRPSLSLCSTPLGAESTVQHFPIPTSLPVTPITALSFVPSKEASHPPQLLLGSNSIHLISLASTTATSVVSTFPGGHSTSIKQLVFVPGSESSSIVTIAESDRSASVWDLPSFPHEPRLKSIIPLSSDILSAALSSTSPPQLALQTLSQIHLFSLAPTANAPPLKNKKNPKPTVLSSSSVLSITEAPSSNPASLLTVAFVSAAEGKIGWARALGGRGVIWEEEEYMEDGAWKKDVDVERRGVGEVLKGEQGVAGSGVSRHCNSTTSSDSLC